MNEFDNQVDSCKECAYLIRAMHMSLPKVDLFAPENEKVMAYITSQNIVLEAIYNLPCKCKCPEGIPHGLYGYVNFLEILIRKESFK